jgi:CPA1 family monovalent cation:H+ antiporter
VLFVLIGLEAVTVAGDFSLVGLGVAIAAIPIVLIARLLSLGVPLAMFSSVPGVGLRSAPFLTWVGLRGAIPIALVLSLPQGKNRDVLVTMTYVVVLFSILVQGTTVKYFRVSKEPDGRFRVA